MHQGYTVDLYPEMRKAVNMLSVHKTLNCQLYVMASLWAMERGLDDCLCRTTAATSSRAVRATSSS